MNKWPLSIVILALMVLTACSSGEERKRHTVAIGVSGQAGSMFPVVKSLCDTWGDVASCQVSPTDNVLQNLEGLQSGALQLGIVRADLLLRAWNGKAPFKAAGMKKLRVLFSLHDELLTLVVPGQSPIDSFNKISGKRVNIGPEGSDNERLINELFKSCKGAASGMIASHLEAMEMGQALANQSTDGFLEPMIHPNAVLAQAALHNRLEVIPLEGDCITSLLKSQNIFEAGVIPAKMYRDVEQDVATVGVKYWVIASTTVPEEVIYPLVKKAFEGIDGLRHGNPVLHYLSPRKMVKVLDVPFHRGAMKYYREKRWFRDL
ncbi:TAXI family TRAP transporter solute-binding subunit [Candidatus Magnetaquicoccus inordinatus]|uniref:TAXI family TRAP transporter solute-binding subunit n=1 Tax=Candidatus Magnetaquicoccus inordinatus TaxID=2496818 RepID=UPI00102AC1B7|nr:TAXI family TRAP transporter solute-binding subunit [Candidatus Magnetaquicoccus inordinatus]